MQNLTSITQNAAGNLTVRSGKTLTVSTINGSAMADPTADGLGVERVARFTFNPTATAGDRTIAAHGTGVTLPINAVVIGGFYEVNTAFTSAGGNAGTVAISVVGANDIKAATAVSDVTFGTTGLKAIVPKSNTPEGTGIKCAAAKEIVCTVAGQALTAGKLTGFIKYVISAPTA